MNGGRDEPEAGQTIPVVEEIAHFGKRAVPVERVRLRKTVSEREESFDIPLQVEELSVERVPVGRAVTEAPAVREENDVLIIPVLEERLVVEKRLFLVEEVHVRLTRRQQRSVSTVRLRREDVEIEHPSQ